jgi:hypothetical protein
MGWDKGRYYTRSKKVNGHVVREYIGIGRAAELIAQIDAAMRERRRVEREEKADLAALDAKMKSMASAADLVARAALLAAGFRQHKRGPWRKHRGQERRPAA